jgi:hypothetical protein
MKNWMLLYDDDDDDNNNNTLFRPILKIDVMQLLKKFCGFYVTRSFTKCSTESTTHYCCNMVVRT